MRATRSAARKTRATHSRPLLAAGIALAGLCAAAALPGCGDRASSGAERGDVAGPADGLPVMLIANAEAGTVSVIDSQTQRLRHTLNIIPDGPTPAVERDPAQALLGQRIVEFAGGLNYAQDLDVAPDARTLYVSRGHRGDVAAFDLASGELLWVSPLDGLRADHMTISPDGARLYVSGLVEDQVYVLDAATGAISGRALTGQWPHDNHLSADGAVLYNASIGNILVEREARAVLASNPLTSPYQISKIDTQSLQVLQRFPFTAGVRPFALNAEETHLYAQLSLYSGVIEYDLEQATISRQLDLPVAPDTGEEDYDFEAPHHGLALSPDGNTLCLAGRISDYVALVDVASFSARAITPVGDAPSWATTSVDGRHCYVPNNREASVSVIDYESGAEIVRVAVDAGPKFGVAARIPADVVAAWSAAP